MTQKEILQTALYGMRCMILDAIKNSKTSPDDDIEKYILPHLYKEEDEIIELLDKEEK